MAGGAVVRFEALDLVGLDLLLVLVAVVVREDLLHGAADDGDLLALRAEVDVGDVAAIAACATLVARLEGLIGS
jgi:hypothetical protein